MPTRNENLITAAKEGNNEKVIELLKSGADPKAKDNNGDTALHWAAECGHAAVVKSLLEAGADLEASSHYGNTALILAAFEGHAAVVKLLLARGAAVNEAGDNGVTALHWAADRGHAAVVTALVQAGANPRAKNDDGNTALCAAARNGHAAVVTALLDAGAEVNAANEAGQTALHFAAENGHPAVVKALLDRGADLEARANNGNTALITAACKGHAAVVTALLNAGADVDATSKYGNTASHLAAYEGHAGIVVKIKKYIKSWEYEWRQHLPRLRQAVWNYYNPVKTSITEGLSPEPELAETVSIGSIADKLIPYFLRSISQPLAFAKLLNDRLSEASPVKGSCMDVFSIVATMLAAKHKIINPKIMENFAKIMAAVDALQKYKGSSPVVAREIIDNIIELTELGKIFSSEGDFVGIDEVITTLSNANYAEVFETTNLWGLTTLQKAISDVSRMLGGDSYPDRSSFVELKKKSDPKREEVVKRRREIEIKMREKTNHPSMQFGLTCSLFDNPDDNKIYNLDGEAATPGL